MKSKGFTLVELVVVLLIIGILAAIALPIFTTSIEKTKAQTAQNNLYAIAAAQSKYYEDRGSYCTGTCGSTSSINTNLSLGLGSTGDRFIYSCSPATGSCPAYKCGATSGPVTLTLCAKALGVTVTCVPVSSCP